MNRHLRIFLGIFCWMACASCVGLAVVNGTATPARSVGVALFAVLAVVMAVVAFLLTRERRAV